MSATKPPIPDNNASAILIPWGAMRSRYASKAAVLGLDGKVLRTFEQVDEEARSLQIALKGWEGSIMAVQIGNDPSWPAVFLASILRAVALVPLGEGVAPPPFAHALMTPGPIVTRLAVNDFPFPGACLLKLTSGTTGAPRAIRFSATQLAADGEQICSTMGIDYGDVNFGAIPVAHSYGFSNLLMPLLLRGVPMVLTNERLPRALHEGLVRTAATVFPGAPVFFQHLAALDAPVPPRLRLCISAGAPLSRADWERFHSRHGLRIHTFYGSSECGGIAYDRRGMLAEEGLVGPPMDGVRIEQRDDGRIEVFSAAVGEGYFPEPEPEMLSRGRFVPGDLVRVGEHGLVIEGRASDVINVAGRKLNPVEVEHLLGSYPGVRGAVVFGTASRLRGEEPVACVAGEGIDPRELLRHCAKSLPAWQVPRDVWVVKEIPVSERGKISRRALAELYLAQQESV